MIAAKLGATYSQHADDLVLSGPRELVRAAPVLVGRLAAIAADEGFSRAMFEQITGTEAKPLRASNRSAKH